MLERVDEGDGHRHSVDIRSQDLGLGGARRDGANHGGPALQYLDDGGGGGRVDRLDDHPVASARRRPVTGDRRADGSGLGDDIVQAVLGPHHAARNQSVNL